MNSWIYLKYIFSCKSLHYLAVAFWRSTVASSLDLPLPHPRLTLWAWLHISTLYPWCFGVGPSVPIRVKDGGLGPESNNGQDIASASVSFLCQTQHIKKQLQIDKLGDKTDLSPVVSSQWWSPLPQFPLVSERVDFPHEQGLGWFCTLHLDSSWHTGGTQCVESNYNPAYEPV